MLKKAIVRITLLVLLFMIALLPAGPAYAKRATLKIDSNTVGMTKKEKKIYKKMKALKKKKLPEGKKWTNAKFYAWNGGGMYYGGYGCVAFAFKVSDAAFGTAPVRMHRSWKKIRVGDIIRLDRDRHSVIVMKVVGKKFVIAEGNYNRRIHWGRVITRSYVKKTGTYVMTRY